METVKYKGTPHPTLPEVPITHLIVPIERFKLEFVLSVEATLLGVPTSSSSIVCFAGVVILLVFKFDS